MEPEPGHRNEEPGPDSSRSDERVDELRQRLRALGYLDAGVDRFVLGPARQARRPAAIALLASVRVGLMAGVLLGPAAAIGVSGRLPGLVTGPRDAVVIALYMGALFGTAVSIAAFAASLLVSSIAAERVARRARPLSVAAGRAVAIACLAYLTLWWRIANAGFGWEAPVWTGFALIVAVGISLLLGHAVRVTTLAVIMAGHPDGDPADSAAGHASWRVSIGTGVLAFAGAGVLLMITAPASGGDRTEGPALTVVPSGLRVRVVAIDGIDPGVLESLSAAGRIPALSAAFRPTRAHLAAENTRDPARAWTTIATGQPAEAHGVRGLETRRVAGLQGTVASGDASGPGGALRAATDLLRLTRPAIASGTERREKTMWEVASDAGLRIAVVNWWATWPASAGGRGDGVVLSDRATLRLERGGALDAEIAPAALYGRLQARWPAIRERAEAMATQSLGTVATGDPGVRAVLLRSAELDAIQLGLAREVSDPRPDLLAVYLPGLDIAQHALVGADGVAGTASSLAARVDGLREYYVFLDRLLQESLAAIDGELVVVVALPGRANPNAAGVMGLAGSVARTDAQIDGRATDVMPTVLHALGVPISRALDGKPLTALLGDAYVQRYPVREVASYGRPSTQRPERTGQPLDQEMIERMRSLGYVR